MAKSERCPFCGASVKSENLIRHLDANHPRNADARAMREELKRQPGRTAWARTRSSFRLRKTHIAVILLVAALGLGAYYVAPLLSSSSNFTTACSGGAIAVHYHTLLVIHVNGVWKEIPADIGLAANETNSQYACPSGQDHVLHTHDQSGVIHNELPGTLTGTPRLSDFFAIWGQPLNSGAAWIYSGSVSAHVYRMGSGQTQDYSSNPGSIPLSEPSNGQDPFSLPSSLLYPGGGDGQSGGLFSGEIVFLNVTVG